MVFLHAVEQKRSILIIETGNNDRINFKKTLDALATAGFEPVFKQAYNVTPSDIAHHNAIWLVLDPSFYSATARDLTKQNSVQTPMLRHLYMLIDHLKTKKNSLIGLIIPVTGNPVLVASITEQLLEKLQLLENKTPENRRYVSHFINHFVRSDESKSQHYRTALLDKRAQAPLQAGSSYPAAPELLAELLPKSVQKIAPLSPLYPLGIKIRNEKTGNTIFLTSMNMIQTTEIKEPFKLTPMDKKLRTALNAQIYSTLRQAVGATKNEPILQSQHRDSLEERFKRILSPAYHRFKNEGIVCAWMNLEPYDGKEQEAVDDISNAGINLMWFELLPEVFLANSAGQKEKKQAFLDSIKRFTQAMKKRETLTSKPLPLFFMGANLTSNLRGIPQRDPACDMYGECYENIPSPFDIEHFWKPEFLTVFDRFVDEWEKNIGNGVPLAGVFLDLEMYHAQNQTGQFLPTMDFSTTAWRLYTKKHPLENNESAATISERVRYLLKTNKMDEYFATLRQEATIIGSLLRTHIKKRLPNALIGAYNINLPNSWFYQGLSKGLSSPTEPLICATFNMEFREHQKELEKQDTHLMHLPVILLSKFKKIEDFELVGQMMKDHDGIWLNKFSRLAQERDPENKIWYNLETTNLETKTVVENLAKSLEAARSENQN